MARNVQRITTLVNDILFLQEMDLVLPEFQAVDMNEVAQHVMGKYTEVAVKLNVDLRLIPTPSLSPVSGDTKSLERALMALVDNAIKFSPKGGVVEIRLNEKGDEILVAVRSRH